MAWERRGERTESMGDGEERKWQESTVENNEIVKEGSGKKTFWKDQWKIPFLVFYFDGNWRKSRKEILATAIPLLCKRQQNKSSPWNSLKVGVQTESLDQAKKFYLWSLETSPTNENLLSPAAIATRIYFKGAQINWNLLLPRRNVLPRFWDVLVSCLERWKQVKMEKILSRPGRKVSTQKYLFRIMYWVLSRSVSMFPVYRSICSQFVEADVIYCEHSLFGFK